MDPGPPPTVGGGRYTLGDIIGRGGAAEVYVARDELLGREVAVKLFPPGVGEADESRRQREVQTLAGLNHPGLVTIYDVGQEGSRAFFVMQLIEGESLADRIRQGPLALGDVVALGSALADALTYVHRHGVVHRDIKPGNVLLDGDGRPHLSDFGIAVLADATNITATGMVIGTASYLSPEQVRGQQVGPASDVYALGLVLLECITARREFPGNALEAAVARLHRAPEIPPDLPPALGQLLAAMTRDDPAERPTTEQIVGEFRMMAREAGLDAETVLAPTPTGTGSMRTTAMGGPGTGATAYVDPMNGPTQRMATPPGGYPGHPPTGGRTALVGADAYGGPPAGPPATPKRSRRGVVLALIAALVVAGAVGAWALINTNNRDTPAPAVAPPSAPALAPSTTSRSRTSEETTTRRRTSSEAPPPTTSVAPPPTSSQPPSTTDQPTTTDTSRGNGGGGGGGDSSTSTPSLPLGNGGRNGRLLGSGGGN